MPYSAHGWIKDATNPPLNCTRFWKEILASFTNWFENSTDVDTILHRRCYIFDKFKVVELCKFILRIIFYHKSTNSSTQWKWLNLKYGFRNCVFQNWHSGYSTHCRGQNIVCTPDILTAYQLQTPPYSGWLLKPFFLAFSLAFCLRSSLYGGCRRTDSRDLSRT